jgi:Ca2+-binding EF-hand superfamily protein
VLSRAWLEIDKTFDCQVDQRELLDFLDSRMKNRKKFDRSVAIEIFKLIDLDQNGKISVEEFIKRYISIEDEIRRDIRDYQKILLVEKENNSRMYKLMMQYKNENLNEKGMGSNAKIILQI